MKYVDYEKIKRKIEEDRKKIRYQYIQGPKGDKGDSGIPNIEIGKVIESEKPEVINVGTNENVILDFKIPRGISEKIIIDKTETISSNEEAKIIDDYKDNTHHLTIKIPKGETGPRGLPGEIGMSDRITIDGIETLDPNEEAEVLDDYERNMHYLTFRIPKGEKGDVEKITIDKTETINPNEEAEVLDDYKDNTHHLTFKIPKGEIGPSGAGVGPTAFNAILYARYKEATDSRALTIQEKIFIPSTTTLYEVPTVTNIDIKTTGIYEITLCGKILGATQDNGGKVFLQNTVTGNIINNLEFELKEGSTENLIFSGMTTTEIFAPATLQVRSNIINDLGASNLTFKDITLTLKRYNM